MCFLYIIILLLFSIYEKVLSLSVPPLEDSRERSDWIGYILLKLNIKNIKYYSKIIFKYVNSIIKLFLIKKLIKNEVCESINSTRIHYLLLIWSTTTTEAKKKGEEENVDLKCKLGSKLTLKFSLNFLIQTYILYFS